MICCHIPCDTVLCHRMLQITPECIAFDIASKCQAQAQRKRVRLGVVLDCFSGVGGNAIAMAAGTQCQVVCAGDIDARKLDMLR